MSSHAISVTVNGQTHRRHVEARVLLCDWLRDSIGLTGTHVGCDTSQCGACTILLNGEAVKSCAVFAVQADGAAVTTIEGLAEAPERLTVLQEAFREKHALQCGYCTPGMIIAASDLLRRNPDPTEAQVRHAMRGNLCRCTGYQHIVEAILEAAPHVRSATSQKRAVEPADRAVIHA